MTNRMASKTLLIMAFIVQLSACEISSNTLQDNPVDDEPTLEPIISQSNYLSILEYAVSIMNEQSFLPLRNLIDITYGPDPYGGSADQQYLKGLGFEEISSAYSPNQQVLLVTYQCDAGGRYMYSQNSSVYGGGGGQFEDCRLFGLSDVLSINGAYYKTNSILKYVFNPGSAITTDYTNISIDDDNQVVSLDGLHVSRYGYLATEGWYDLAYLSQNVTGEIVINLDTLEFTDGSEIGVESERRWKRTMFADFNVKAPETGLHQLEISTVEPFETPFANTCYLSGTLSIVAGDGSSLTMIADNGDIDSFQLQLVNDNATSVHTIPWSSANAMQQLTLATQWPYDLPVVEGYHTPEVCQ